MFLRAVFTGLVAAEGGFDCLLSSVSASFGGSVSSAEVESLHNWRADVWPVGGLAHGRDEGTAKLAEIDLLLFRGTFNGDISPSDFNGTLETV